MDEQQMQQQIVQLVQAAQKGDQRAVQYIQQVMQAAQQGDQKAIQLAQMIQAVMQQMGQMARKGAKLAYLQSLRGVCPDGYERKFAKGGSICTKCEQGKKTSAIESFKNEHKVEMNKCGGKKKLVKKSELGGKTNKPKIEHKEVADTTITIGGKKVRGKYDRYTKDGLSTISLKTKDGKSHYGINESVDDEWGYPEAKSIHDKNAAEYKKQKKPIKKSCGGLMSKKNNK